MKSTCPYCGVGCGICVQGSVISGDAAHPANFGRLCVKGSTLAQTLDDTARLMHPMVGGRETGWSEALDLVAERMGATIAQHGPDSVALYGSGQFLTEDYYVANKLMKGFIGTANIDTNSRLCMASTVAGHIRAFGEDIVPGCYEDIDEADLLVFVGANAAWCHPVLFERAQAARAARGTKIVVIDPRKTASAALADLHIAINPDADTALFNHLLTAIAARGMLDETYIARHTNGFASALKAAQTSLNETGVAPEVLENFVDLFCKTPRTVTLFSQGVNQSASGTDKVNAIINVHLATGRIGKPGCGPFSLTGQPNAMGGREVGGLANQLAAHLRPENASHRALLAQFWQTKNLPPRPGLKAVEMFDAVLSGKIKSIWIAATNPAESLPRAQRVRAALEACPFVVVSDCWSTETTRLANVVLPAAGWGEKDGTVTNSERTISRQRPFRKPPGQARPDWWMFTETARRMGFAEAFPYQRPAEIFREHARLSGFANKGDRIFNIAPLAGVTDDEYDALSPLQWPLGHKRLFANGIFATPSGRAQFIEVHPPAFVSDASYPFRLNTGRLRDQWHTMTRTGFVPALMASTGEAVAALAPTDAARLNLHEHDLLRITTRHASTVLPVQITPAQRPGELFAAMHWTNAHSAAGNINQLVGPTSDPHSGQPALKHEMAALQALPSRWHGILQSRASLTASGQFHMARRPLASGMYLSNLKGWKILPAGLALSDWAARLCGADADDERVEFIDAARSAYRLGIFRHGRLQSCLFIAATHPALPQPEALAALFGAPASASPGSRASILRGTLTPQPTSGRIVCICHNVSETTIRGLVEGQGLASVAAIGAACKAGTNCGSCKGELAEYLEQYPIRLNRRFSVIG